MNWRSVAIGALIIGLGLLGLVTGFWIAFWPRG